MYKMDNIGGVVAFVRTAETRSFTKAAVQLGLSQSGVSKAISRLEDQYKVRLLTRTSRSVSMTPEGVAFYHCCRQILTDLEVAEQLLSQSSVTFRGVLRVTLPVSVGRLHLARALPEFVRRYPEVTVEVSLTDRLVDLVEEGYDLAVRMGRAPDARLVVRQLGRAKMTTCASPAYLKAHGIPRTPEDLLAHNCVRFVVPSSGRVQDWRFARNGESRSVAVTGNLTFDHAESLVQAALAGSGLIQISSHITAPAIRDGTLKPVLARFQIDSPALWVMYPKNRHMTPRVRALVDFLLEWAKIIRLEHR